MFQQNYKKKYLESKNIYIIMNGGGDIEKNIIFHFLKIQDISFPRIIYNSLRRECTGKSLLNVLIEINDDHYTDYDDKKYIFHLESPKLGDRSVFEGDLIHYLRRSIELLDYEDNHVGNPIFIKQRDPDNLINLNRNHNLRGVENSWYNDFINSFIIEDGIDRYIHLVNMHYFLNDVMGFERLSTIFTIKIECIIKSRDITPSILDFI